jgi:hypothetical protein
MIKLGSSGPVASAIATSDPRMNTSQTVNHTGLLAMSRAYQGSSRRDAGCIPLQMLAVRSELHQSETVQSEVHQSGSKRARNPTERMLAVTRAKLAWPWAKRAEGHRGVGHP